LTKLEESELTKILCVDDEPFILNSIERIFSEEFDVFKAVSGADALNLIQQHDFDVIISDQRMPGMTGTEFLEKARHHAPRAIRVLLTGYADLEAVRSAVNEGEVFRYITKPWNNKDLRTVVYAGVQAARSGDAQKLLGNSHGDATAFSPILVIDSDQQVYDTCQSVVGKNGQVAFANSVEQGLGYLHNIKELGIVITAIKIGPDNTELLIKSIKAFHPSVVTILVSEMHDAELIVRLINEGQIFRCLFKPTKVDTMQRMLMNAQVRHKALENSSDLLARFQVPVPIEIQTAQKTDTSTTPDTKRGWTQRFASLFYRSRA
jgi:DNA-binding NtrC family response regulator